MNFKKTLARNTRWLRGVPKPRDTSSDAAVFSDKELQRLLAWVDGQSHPTINPLRIATRDHELLALNIKAMGYQLARQLGASLSTEGPDVPPMVNLGSKLSTQADIESDWFAYWCRQLRLQPMYHRKLWEFAYLLQAFHEAGQLKPGQRGLGFGCGVEPMASYFANLGMRVMMTDLSSEDARAAGWATNNEHAPNLLHAHNPSLVDQETFLRQVDYRNVDMNAIPDDLRDYDFCWSICALEHLGTIDLGLTFIENSLKTLRPGGVAVHTTEFNINPDGPTIDDWVTVLFQRKHIEALAQRLEAEGHKVATLDFNAGDGPMDHFIDLPPWSEGSMATLSRNLGQPLHLKVGSDGFPCTCLGLTITKALA